MGTETTIGFIHNGDRNLYEARVRLYTIHNDIENLRNGIPPMRFWKLPFGRGHVPSLDQDYCNRLLAKALQYQDRYQKEYERALEMSSLYSTVFIGSFCYVKDNGSFKYGKVTKLNKKSFTVTTMCGKKSRFSYTRIGTDRFREFNAPNYCTSEVEVPAYGTKLYKLIENKFEKKVA